MLAATLDGITQLSAAERIQLVEDIWDTIAAHPEEINLSEAQTQELDRRLADYRQDPQSGASWQEVQQRVRGQGMMTEMSEEFEPLPEIIVRPEAEAEITEAFRWYEDKNEGLGSEFMRALDASLSYIQRHPTAYAKVHKQMRRALLRRFPYSVIYLVESDHIIVLACFHASRDPKQWRGRA